MIRRLKGWARWLGVRLWRWSTPKKTSQTFLSQHELNEIVQKAVKKLVHQRQVEFRVKYPGFSVADISEVTKLPEEEVLSALLELSLPVLGAGGKLIRPPLVHQPNPWGSWFAGVKDLDKFDYRNY